MTSGLRSSIIQWILLLLFESLSDVCLHFSLVNLEFPAGVERWSSAQMVPWDWEVCDGSTLRRGGRESAGWQRQSVRTGKAMRKYRARQERRPGRGREGQDWLGGGGCTVGCHTARGKQQASWPPAPTCRHCWQTQSQATQLPGQGSPSF